MYADSLEALLLQATMAAMATTVAATATDMVTATTMLLYPVVLSSVFKKNGPVEIRWELSPNAALFIRPPLALLHDEVQFPLGHADT